MTAVVPIAESDLIGSVRSTTEISGLQSVLITGYDWRGYGTATLVCAVGSRMVGPPKLRSGIHPQTVRSESCMKDELRGLVAYDE